MWAEIESLNIADLDLLYKKLEDEDAELYSGGVGIQNNDFRLTQDCLLLMNLSPHKRWYYQGCGQNPLVISKKFLRITALPCHRVNLKQQLLTTPYYQRGQRAAKVIRYSSKPMLSPRQRANINH
jgi:hypothetical protein